MISELMKNLSKYNIVLASRSPRRQMLLRGLDLNFQVILKETPEDYPEGLHGREIAWLLARRKSFAFIPEELPENFLLITADTLVWLDGKVLNKPAHREEAIRMLSKLSGNTHEVYTGVCLRTFNLEVTFVAETRVDFRPLDAEEIEYYVDQYPPFDKAGAYGAQDWIGYIGISHIEGSYFNVMGLPVQMLYHHLKAF